jgi:tRNA pseudouridine38-40 synthase
MREAAKWLMGEHDFTSFSASGTEVEDRVRTIYNLSIQEEGNRLLFTFHGNGFLYNMVRILVGTLLDVGAGKIRSMEVPEILAAKDRKKAGPTAPPQGLALMKVEYPEGRLSNLFCEKN